MRTPFVLALCVLAAACVSQKSLGANRDAGVDAASGDAGPCGTCAINEACNPVSLECDFCDTLEGGCRPRDARLAVGDAHLCVVSADARLFCMGDNSEGQLGLAGVTTQETLRRVPNVDSPIEVEAGAHHTCVRSFSSASATECFGLGTHGELGNGMFMSTSTPQRLLMDSTTILDSLVEISAGSRHTCVRESNAIVLCAGDNTDGQTAVFDDPSHFGSAPVRGAMSISAGDAHTCIVPSEGRVYCWGKADDNRLGSDDFAPVEVPSISEAMAVSAGDAHTCALMRSGTVSCWGRNEAGQTSGDETVQEVHPVIGLDHVVAISAGRLHTCALKDDRSLWCWGSNSFGELGMDPAIVASSRAPMLVASLPINGEIAEMSAGGHRTCALAVSQVAGENGALYCWGEHFAVLPQQIAF